MPSVAGPSMISRTRTRARISCIQREPKIYFQYLLPAASFPAFLLGSMLLPSTRAPPLFTMLKSSACSLNGTSTVSNLRAKRTRRRSKRLKGDMFWTPKLSSRGQPRYSYRGGVVGQWILGGGMVFTQHGLDCGIIVSVEKASCTILETLSVRLSLSLLLNGQDHNVV